MTTVVLLLLLDGLPEDECCLGEADESEVEADSSDADSSSPSLLLVELK